LDSRLEKICFQSQEAAIRGIVKHLGIALQKRDSSLVAFVSIVTFQMAGANAPSTFALTLLIVVGYWLAFDKPR
jgi:hypothetical protein